VSAFIAETRAENSNLKRKYPVTCDIFVPFMKTAGGCTFESLGAHFSKASSTVVEVFKERLVVLCPLIFSTLCKVASKGHFSSYSPLLKGIHNRYENHLVNDWS
jgi:hypothetical protein